jgi:dTDP-4-dehydrorhamnose 3,5-epimerase
MSFTFRSLDIPDVVLVRPERHHDTRGAFTETYRRSAFLAGGIDADFVQDNFVRSGPGVLRGLHYQRPPSAQGKLVQVLRGRVFDVSVDLRRGSPSFGLWVARELSGDSGEGLWIPAGFAHGYAVLSDGADLVYKVTREYDAAREAGVRWDDPTLAIPWPLDRPVVSDRDRSLPGLHEAQAAS